MADSDLLIFPSHATEGFGLPLLEAMSRGVPYVASDIPSVRHMTSPDPEARLIPVADVNAFRVEAYRLLTNKKYWRSRQMGGLRAARSFEWESVSASLVESIRTIWRMTRDQEY